MSDSRPDWVIIGVSTSDGVIVLGSTEMTQAELETEYEEIDGWGNQYPTRTTRTRTTLTAEMRGYVVAAAPTYPEAMDILFKQWTPEAQRRSLGADTKALGHS